MAKSLPWDFRLKRKYQLCGWLIRGSISPVLINAVTRNCFRKYLHLVLTMATVYLQTCKPRHDSSFTGHNRQLTNLMGICLCVCQTDAVWTPPGQFCYNPLCGLTHQREHLSSIGLSRDKSCFCIYNRSPRYGVIYTGGDRDSGSRSR